MFSCDSRDRAKQLRRIVYVSTPGGRTTTTNRANHSDVKLGSSVWTIMVILRCAVEMLVGELVSTRQSDSNSTQYRQSNWHLPIFIFFTNSCTKRTHFAAAK